MKDKKNDAQTEALVPLIFNVIRLVREQTAGKGKLDAVSLVQIKILAFVLEKDNPTMNEIAKSLLITAPSATSAIQLLVKDGQLKRITDDTDRRVVRLKITSKGTAIFKKRRSDATKIIGKMLVDLKDREKNDFANILTKIINSQNNSQTNSKKIK